VLNGGTGPFLACGAGRGQGAAGSAGRRAMRPATLGTWAEDKRLAATPSPQPPRPQASSRVSAAKSNFLSVLLALILPVGCIHASGNTYYVSPTGNDSNDGLSIADAHAWLTANKAGTVSLNPGDIVYFLTGTYGKLFSNSSGSAGGGYITFAAYPGHTPVFTPTSGSAILTSASDATTAKSYLKYVGLTATVTSASSGSGWNIFVGSDHTWIKDCICDNAYESGILSDQNNQGGTNILIEGCKISGTNRSGNYEAISFRGVVGFEIKNCIVHDTLGHLSLLGAGGIYYHDKEGIDCGKGCTNGSIHDNEVYNCKIGIYIDSATSATDNIDVYRNKVHDCWDTGIGLYSETASPHNATDIVIWNNLIYNCTVGFATCYAGWSLTFTLINNSFWNSGADLSYHKNGDGASFSTISPVEQISISSSPTYVSCIIRNNICVSHHGNISDIIHYDDAGETGITNDHNLFYDSLGYKASNQYGANNVTADPLMTNPAAGDFTLQAGSPAIDVGSSTGAPADDYIGTSRPQGSAFDIGAYELIQNPPPPGQQPRFRRQIKFPISVEGNPARKYVAVDGGRSENDTKKGMPPTGRLTR
jgi:hypothetical protein